MAEKEEDKAEDKAGPKEDDDDLDALLDSALEDFDNLQSPCKQISVPKESQKAESAKKEVPTQNDMGLSESDIEAAAAEFEKSMKTILGNDEELLKQWQEFAEKGTFCTDEAENGGSADASPQDVEAFEAHLFKTMKDMTENAKEMTNSPEMDENYFKAMADINIDGGAPGFSNDIFPMMQGMMMNLLSKDVLYPALDELRTKYPPWLEEKKSILKSDVYGNYMQQYKMVCEICSEYDKESKQDTEETKKKRFDKLMGLMQKMQQYGQPPQELVGSERHFPEVGKQGNMGDGFPPDKCPMM